MMLNSIQSPQLLATDCELTFLSNTKIIDIFWHPIPISVSRNSSILLANRCGRFYGGYTAMTKSKSGFQKHIKQKDIGTIVFPYCVVHKQALAVKTTGFSVSTVQLNL